MNSIKNQKLACVLILIAIMVVFAGCGHKNSNIISSADNPETPPDIKVDDAPKFDEPVQCPLCGETVEKRDIERAVAVMIENHPAARPQSGMNNADIVYELLTEGGITRFLAVNIHDHMSTVGPVRSSRHYFLDLVMEYNAIYVYYGFSPQAQADIPKLKIQGINGLYDSSTYWRDSTRKQPHDAYTTMERIRARSEKLGFKNDKECRIFSFSDKDYSPSEAEALQVKVYYPIKYEVKYKYDPDKKLYFRYINDKPHTDRETGSQLSARNIIIQYTSTKVIDNEGRLNVILVGKGEGYYITGGGMEKIKWDKKTRQSPTNYFDSNGKEIELNPGKTWIQVVPLNTKVVFDGETDENK